MRNRTRVHNPLHHTSFGDGIPDRELRRLDQLGTIVTLRSDTDVIRQHEAGRQCLVVVDGVLHVDRDGDHVADLGAGEVAGEMALLTGRRCNANVVAESGTAVYAMSRRELATLVDNCPTIATRLWRSTLTRMAPTS
jgi:CRP-like cAMP-binding protein